MIPKMLDPIITLANVSSAVHVFMGEAGVIWQSPDEKIGGFFEKIPLANQTGI